MPNKQFTITVQATCVAPTYKKLEVSAKTKNEAMLKAKEYMIDSRNFSGKQASDFGVIYESDWGIDEINCLVVNDTDEDLEFTIEKKAKPKLG